MKFDALSYIRRVSLSLGLILYGFVKGKGNGAGSNAPLILPFPVAKKLALILRSADCLVYRLLHTEISWYKGKVYRTVGFLGSSALQ